MFKKTTTGKKPKSIRRRVDSDDEEDDDHGASDGVGRGQRPDDDDEEGANDGNNNNNNNNDAITTHQVLQETRKKRKLLTAVQYKRGVSATQLMQKDSSMTRNGTNGKAPSGDDANPAVKTAAETSRDGALERKHREAMEAFIEERMKKDKPSKDYPLAAPATTITTDFEEMLKSSSNKPLTEEALYMDLAAQSAQLAGKPIQQQQDDDEEERGAVLVAGTGIAEVILPVTERLKVAQETELAQARQHRDRALNATATGTKTAPLSGVPNRFAVSSNMNHSDFNRQYARDSVIPSSTTVQQSTNDSSTRAERQSTADAARPGFESTRPSHRPANQQGTTSQRNQASDHRVFAKFVTRQRELRK